MSTLTDVDKLHAILYNTTTIRGPGGWIRHDEILDACRHRYHHGLTVHSRVSDLRKRGIEVECKVERRKGRATSYYRLTP